MLNEKQLIETLKTETSKDPVTSAVLHVFAARERARAQVTIPALVARMKEEGFLYAPGEYGKVLKLLASLGVGRLDTDSSGKVRALKDVKVTLQSIGMAALGQATVIEPISTRNKFQRIPVVHAAPIKKPPVAISAPIIKSEPPDHGHRPRVQPRPAEGVWEVLCVPLKSGETFKTYVPKGLTKEDAKLIGQALSDMAKS